MDAIASPPRSILVVDDEPVVRQRLRRVLAQVAPEAVCAEADDLRQARAQLRGATFDWVLLDVGLPDGIGLALLDWLREHAPDATRWWCPASVTTPPCCRRSRAALSAICSRTAATSN